MIRKAFFTVSTAGLWGQQKLSLEDSIALAAELGYDGVEIMTKRPHLSVLDYSVEDCHRLAERIKKYGLEVAALAGYTNFTGGMEAAEVPFTEMQVLYVTELARRAQVLGCDLVRVFTSYDRGEVSPARQWQMTVESIRECCKRAAEFGVSIGVQNHHDVAVDTRSYVEFLRQVDCENLVPLYDCWSVYLRGEDVRAGVRQMAGKMRFTTVADYIVLPRWRYRPELVNYQPCDPPFVQAVPMGEGDLDYEGFFGALVESGFDGWVSYENCSPLRGGGSLENLKAYSRKFLEYMKRFG